MKFKEYFVSNRQHNQLRERTPINVAITNNKLQSNSIMTICKVILILVFTCSVQSFWFQPNGAKPEYVTSTTKSPHDYGVDVTSPIHHYLQPDSFYVILFYVVTIS
jgi:hypothetical protein